MTGIERFLRALAGAALLLVSIGGCERAAVDPLAQARGEWLLINYWAEWCKPCLDEIPELNAFASMHEERARVLMVNFDGVRGDELRAQAGRLGIEVELLESDPGTRFGFERPQALPATFVIRPDGTVAATLLGPQTVSSLAAAIGAH